MRAELKGLHSPDVDLESWVPEDTRNFSVYVQAMIGKPDGDGAESFGFTLCSPQALAESTGREAPRFLHGYLVLEYYSYGELQSAVEKLIRGTSGDTWQELAHKLGRFMLWEFEGYQEKS